MTDTAKTTDREIVVTRLLGASRERVWAALCELKQREAWWGPDGFTNETEHCAWTVGGEWVFVMVGPDGTRFPNRLELTVLVENERIEYTQSGGAEGEPGNRFRGMWTLADEDGKTRLTIRIVFESAAERDLVAERYGAVEGGEQTLGRLAERLAVEPAYELQFERTIAAPRERVFRTWTDPAQLAEWFAPRPFQLVVNAFDLQPGGTFEMAMRPPLGEDLPFTGTYREVVPPERLVWNSAFPDGPADQITTVLRLDEVDGQTRLRVRQTFHVMTPISERAVKGAERGWAMTLDQMQAFCEGRPASATSAT